MSTYEKAPPEVARMVREIMQEHHKQLAEAGVTIDVLMAHGAVDPQTGEVTGPAIRHQGYLAAACVRIVNKRDRAKGMGDAEIQLDGDRWDGWPEATQRAIIDHELTHLQVKPVGEDAYREDDMGRPKLHMRLHDQQFGWFDDIAKRHGEASLEIQQAQTLAGQRGQLYFGFSEPAVTTLLRGVGRSESETPRRRGRAAAASAEAPSTH